MKKGLITTIVALVAMPALGQGFNPQKHFSVGLSSFATVIQSSTYQADSVDFTGFSVFGTGAVNDNIAFRAIFGRQSYNEDADLKVNAFEGGALAGTGLATEGFKIYGSLGLYRETWSYTGGTEKYDFSGLMLGGGLGYDWSSVALDFWINFRNSSDYDAFIGVDTAAASGGLGLAFRF